MILTLAAGTAAASPTWAKVAPHELDHVLVVASGGETHSVGVSAAALAGRLAGVDLRALRAGHGGRVAVAAIARRERSLRTLQPRVDAAQLHLMPLVEALRRLGGRQITVDALNLTIVAVLPRSAVAAIRRRGDVRSVSPLPRAQPLGPGNWTGYVGAPTIWATGHTGGLGASDIVPASLAILDDKIQWDHPAFAGVPLERPTGTSTSGTLHGTAVAAMAISRGASGCGICVPADAGEKGVAPGLGHVLDAQAPSGCNSGTWSLGLDQECLPQGSGVFLSGAVSPAEIWNGSYGGYDPGIDDNVELQNVDKFTSVYGVTQSYSAGNDGPAQTLSSPSIAPNAISVAGLTDGGTPSTADDSVASFSSRGPTPAGRKKPDLSAYGDVSTARHDWQSTGLLWRGETGTSYAAPQVAGAAAILAGAGVVEPIVQKAILINSARPVGAQTTWSPASGWGALDLAAASAQIASTNYDATSVAAAGSASGGARFYAASSSGGRRTTLVWNRRVNGSIICCSANTVHALTNLDLYELDAATGATRADSSSTIDNVEQVASPDPAAVVYKVKAAGAIDGAPSERYAIASASALTPLASPQPTVGLSQSSGRARGGAAVTVTVAVSNPSPDLTAEATQVALATPAGVQVTAASSTAGSCAGAGCTLGTLAKAGQPGAAQTATFTVVGTGDLTGPLTASAMATRYGETFTSSAAGQLQVDSTGPSSTVSTPSGTQSSASVPIAWGASDGSGVGVEHYDVLVSTDGQPAQPLIGPTTATALTFTGQPGHRYRFLVRATDAVGNVGPDASSPELTIASKPSDCRATHRCPAKTSPALSLSQATWTATRLTLLGRSRRDLRGRVRVAVRCSGRVLVRRTVVTANGRWTVRIALPRSCRLRRTLALTVQFGGDATHRSQTLRRTLRRSG
jgi:hypothetical protein